MRQVYQLWTVASRRRALIKKCLFYTQGDYGLFQCSKPCHDKTYENEDMIRPMGLSQDWKIAGNNERVLPENLTFQMTVPTDFYLPARSA